MRDVAFIFCTEKAIETQSVLLAQSIRDWGGILSKAPIYSFQPRPGKEVSSWVLDSFKKLGVTHITKPLNTHLQDYPPGNKALVCAYAEEHLPHDYYILSDSDMLVVNDLPFLSSMDHDIGLRPVDKKGIGFMATDEPNYAYWKDLFARNEVSEPRFSVSTTVSDDEIAGYWNSGFVLVRGGSGIFGRWKETLELIRREKIEPASSAFFLDQIALAAMLHGSSDALTQLPLGYNYPIHRHVLNQIPAKNRVRSMKDLYSVHYHDLLDDPFFLNMFDTLEGGRPYKQWLTEVVKKYRVAPHHNTIQRWYQQLRLKAYRTLKSRR